MKHQQVSVDYWAMGKAMLTYGALTGLVWLMLRLFSAMFSLPRRLRAQQESMQNTLAELQRRYPDLNITEEDLRDAEKELDELTKEDDENEKADKEKTEKELPEKTTQESMPIEDKKNS
ncbi:uncharacterized protein LOC113232074 [Hyposmocoma kahamanoa]|uniref:uncharacterized protein LOC113232074 n=1 Tax=Hyposmocoma kahamanoa TaxID=1477025 RepID=UPI000E6D9C39|nr:uncharacterized protein LOC113232074 [Hyposmocoma kahamanoa]